MSGYEYLGQEVCFCTTMVTDHPHAPADNWETSAHLLASAGLNLADLTYRVEQATAPSALGGTFEPLIPLGDSDVDVSIVLRIYLRSPHATCVSLLTPFVAAVVSSSNRVTSGTPASSSSSPLCPSRTRNSLIRFTKRSTRACGPLGMPRSARFLTRSARGTSLHPARLPSVAASVRAPLVAPSGVA